MFFGIMLKVFFFFPISTTLAIKPHYQPAEHVEPDEQVEEGETLTFVDEVQGINSLDELEEKTLSIFKRIGDMSRSGGKSDVGGPSALVQTESIDIPRKGGHLLSRGLLQGEQNRDPMAEENKIAEDSILDKVSYLQLHHVSNKLPTEQDDGSSVKKETRLVVKETRGFDEKYLKDKKYHGYSSSEGGSFVQKTKERLLIRSKKKRDVGFVASTTADDTSTTETDDSSDEDADLTPECRKVYVRPTSADYARLEQENAQLASLSRQLIAVNPHYHSLPKLGVIRLDYKYPPSIGDIDHPASYGYPVMYVKVPGLSFQVAQWCPKLPFEVKDNFIKALDQLTKMQVYAITGSCGFMIHFQKLAMKHSSAVVAMSSLNLLPTLKTMVNVEYKVLEHGGEKKMLTNMRDVAIFTANGASLGPLRVVLEAAMASRFDFETGETKEAKFCAEKDDCSSRTLSKFHIIGMENVPVFGKAVADGTVVPLNEALPYVKKLMTETLGKYSNIGTIVMECTELPPFSSELKKLIQSINPRIRYYDSISSVDFAMSGGMPRYYPKVFNSQDATNEEGLKAINLFTPSTLAKAWPHYKGGSVPYPLVMDRKWNDRKTQI